MRKKSSYLINKIQHRGLSSLIGALLPNQIKNGVLWGRIWSVSILFLGLSTTLCGQSMTLSLEDCIQLAKTNSPYLKIAQKNLEAAQWEYHIFKANLRPMVNLGGSLPGLSRSISTVTQPDGTNLFVEQNQANSSSFLSISQPIFITGGSISVSSSLNRLDIFGPGGQGYWSSRPLNISLSQPILAYNRMKWTRKIAPLSYRIAQSQFVEVVEDLSIQVASDFFDLFLAESQISNAEFNLQINDTVLTISRGRYNVGKIAENDLLQTELVQMRSRTDLDQAKIAYKEALQALRITLGLPDEAEIKLQSPTVVPEFELDHDAALSLALLHQSTQLNFALRQLNAESEVARARRDRGFSGNIGASFGLNQTGTSIQETYSQPQNSQSVNFSFSMPLLDWGKGKATYKISQAQRERVFEEIQLEDRQFRQEVINNLNRFDQLRRQAEIDSRADTISVKRFDVAKNRYLIGKNDITNLQQAQNEKDRARDTYIQTLKRLWSTYYGIRKLTHFDFIEGREIEAL